MVTDHITNTNTVESELNCNELTPTDQDTNTHYVNMVTDNTTNINTVESELNCNELTPTNQETNTHYVNMVTDNITNINTVESELNFNELAPTGKTENYVLLNNQHFENNLDQDNLNNDLRAYTNIAGKEAKPPKAPRFIFPLKDNKIPENLLIDKRSEIDKF